MPNEYRKENAEEAIAPFQPHPLKPIVLQRDEVLKVGDTVVPKFVPVDDMTKQHQIKTENSLMIVRVYGRGEKSYCSFAGTEGSYLTCFFKKKPLS